MLADLREDWRVVLGVVSGGHFLSHFYKLALPPLFPLFRQDFGLSNAELGLVVSVLVVGGLLQAPVGNLVDRIGAKWVFVLGVGVTAGGIGLIGIAPATYPVLLAFAVVSGVGQAAFHPADYALIDAVTEPDVQGRALSVHTFSGFAGYAVVPVVVGGLAYTIGWRVALALVGTVGVLYALGSVLALAPAYRAKIDSDESDSDAEAASSESALSALLRPGVLAMLGFFLITTFASRGIQSFTTVLAVDAFALAESVGNTLLTVYFAFGAVGVLVGGVLADRYQPGRIIAATLVAGAAVLLATVTGLVPTGYRWLLGLFGLSGFFISLITPARDRLVIELSASDSMGQSFGFVFTGATVGAALGPVALGVVADLTSITVPFLVIGALYVGAGVLAFAIGRGVTVPTPTVAPSADD